MEAEVLNPFFPPLIYPADNPPTIEKIELGRKLFFDPILSRDSTISCGSCHIEEMAFSDTTSVSSGFHAREGNRNSPPLENLAWRKSFFRDGGIRTLELQVFAPIFDSSEMAFNVYQIEQRLQANQEYRDLFHKAFKKEPDMYGVVRALASFERTITSSQSKFDEFILGNDSALNETERLGATLFFNNKTSCSSCHSGVFFSDENFYSIGIESADPGRQRITLKATDSTKFQTPSLRNVSKTYPYMHNGSLSSLEKVIEHYNSGGIDHPYKDPRVRPLGLSEQEKAALVAFLKCL